MDTSYKVLHIALIGCPKGKTCLLNRYLEGVFDSQSNDRSLCRTSMVKIDEILWKLNLWDTNGLVMEGIRPQFYISYMSEIIGLINAAFLVFDVTKAETFESIKFLVKNQKMPGDDLDLNYSKLKEVPILLVATKCDPNGGDRQVPFETAMDFAYEHNLQYIETSCVTGENVEEAFITMAALAVKNTLIPTPAEGTESARNTGSLSYCTIL